MSEQIQFGSPQPLRRLQRTHLLRLLLCSVIWAAVSFGCATVNYVTDVIYTESGYGAVVSFELEYYSGVYDALQDIDPAMTSAFPANRQEAGWAVEEKLEGRKVLMRYSFDSLEALQNAPKLLVGEEEDLSNALIQSLAVTAREINSETVEYRYTATVMIQATGEESSSPPAEGEGDPFALDDMLSEYPELQAALDEAGPATIVIQAYLPGQITSFTPAGIDEGQRDGGRVRWTFREDQPGTYQLEAVSTGPSAAVVQRDLAETFGSSQHISAFEEVMEVESMDRPFLALGAVQVIEEVRQELKQDPAVKSYTRIEEALFEAAYMAQFCELGGIKTSCMMPSVYRAMPLLKKLAVTLGDDESSVAAFESLVAQLIEHDLLVLQEQSEQ